MFRSTLFIAAFSALFGLSRALDEFLRLFLHQDSGESFLPALARNAAFVEWLWPLLGWTTLGLLAALGLAALLARRTELERSEILAVLARPYLTLLVPAGLTFLAAGSLVVSPSFPYGANLAMTLALEGAFATLLAALLFFGALVHALLELLGPWERRLPTLAIFGLAMVCFLVATPARFYQAGVGQGNMHKYVRMAQAVAGTGTLNIERGGENPDPTVGEFLGHLPRIASSYVRASRSLLAHRGGEAKAAKVNRSMFRSIDGGVYYINAPGPGFLLVPAYILDSYLNRRLGGDRQIAIIVFWQLLGALLVLEIVASVATMNARPEGVVTALAMALAVPFLFYTFQIYPELPGGLFLVFAFRKLVLDPAPAAGAVFAGALALAALPWLHQKYSVASAVLGILAAWSLLRTSPGGWSHRRYKLVLLGLPLAISAYSIFLYNHALTGSLSPTATFSAAERSSFEPWNFFKGLSGLLLDRENGLLVFAPIYIFALVGLQAFFLRHRAIFTPFVLVIASYIVVIASFPYWPGAVSTMGRYILSILPLLALPMALVVGRSFTDGVLAGVGATLLAGTLSYSASFVRDLIPSYQPLIFWGRVLYSDPHQYLPSFLSDGFLGSGAAHFPKFLMLLVAAGALVYFLRERIYQEPFSVEAEAAAYHRRACFGAAAVLLALIATGFVLERWPGNGSEKRGPLFRETRVLRGGETLSVFGEHGFESGGVWVPGGGTTSFLLLSDEPLSEITLRLRNGPAANTVAFRERREPKQILDLPSGGPHNRPVLLRKPYRFDGKNGERFLYRFEVHSTGSFVPRDEGTSDDGRNLGTFVRLR